jgi:hypothetical protein
MTETVSTVEKFGWTAILAVLAVFAIPWFLWGIDRVVLGLPIWLWWHIVWMSLAGITFWLFTTRAWGIWITDRDSAATTQRGQS